MERPPEEGGKNSYWTKNEVRIMKSILETRKGTCYACGAETTTQDHHIFYGTANRKLSERYGLKVFLCLDCHLNNRTDVHGGNQELDQKLKEEGQLQFERKHGSRVDFINIFGRNYL